MIKKLEEGKIMVIENILKEHAECLDDKKCKPHTRFNMLLIM